ncbi:MAG TPA: hypothetical protein VFL41_02740 [Gaiellaceae bacterium]|nr:hypothetical protein [Gaiellaceae bacterium]HET8653563.1 hypothetical protein [Gaiellaceae bacterium]
MVSAELDRLPDEQRLAFFEEYDRRRRSKGWAWVTWFIGWHFVYLYGRWGLNVLYFLAFGITLGIWWLIEGFKLPRRLKERNADIAIAVMRDLRAVEGRDAEAAAT